MLTWHDNTIPDDQIWVKVGGDHGGGSFKFCVHVCNLPKPNSPANTICALVFEGKDYRENLEKVLEDLAKQLQALQETKWRYVLSCVEVNTWLTTQMFKEKKP